MTNCLHQKQVKCVFKHKPLSTIGRNSVISTCYFIKLKCSNLINLNKSIVQIGLKKR